MAPHVPDYTPNPKLDLVLERTVAAPPSKVWAAWTQPEHVVKWFTPAPWVTTKCEIDLRPGGKFLTHGKGPDTPEGPHVTACYLEIIEHRKLVWTTALLPGFRPGDVGIEMPAITAVILFEPAGSGTKYTAIAMHRDEGDNRKHEEMGFFDGWGAVTTQLEEVAKGL
jgi:uncharacterized protein YndB with AHSA1/START domain